MTSPDELQGFVDLAKRLSSDLAEYAAKPHAPPPSPDAEAEVEPLPPGDAALVAYDERITDERLRAATRERFVAKFYADAVETGVKALCALMRERTGSELDGDSLMTEVLSANNPKLRVPARLRSDNERSEQRGYMMLGQGVVAAWRNPRAHQILDDEPEQALVMLGTIQLLMEVVTNATRTRQSKK